MQGIMIGFFTFLIIGLLHPVVIKGEYYFGTKPWIVFLISGLICIYAAFKVQDIVYSSLLAVLGFSLLWSIHEIFEQKERVEKGWFPANPKRNNKIIKQELKFRTNK